ncbi:MAG TPA: hypothetical protein VGA06_00395 [Candidatus Paceibacterota bacterium]|jgi:hypothetical protein
MSTGTYILYFWQPVLRHIYRNGSERPCDCEKEVLQIKKSIRFEVESKEDAVTQARLFLEQETVKCEGVIHKRKLAEFLYEEVLSAEVFATG